jgi:pantoate--beta-alanine ligase
MEIIREIADMKEFVRNTKKAGQTIGFVPTMGYLHEGHLTLMREAKAACDIVIASIFVNPLQFGEGEDYEDYPRDLTRDTALAESAGVHVIFAPSVAAMYPKTYASYVDVAAITDRLCGASRPGHFRGVTTVVTKLFNIVQPEQAFFGQKDAQQVAVIRRMVRDLNMNLSIIVVPIVREADGLAMSSRNVYLSQAERAAALVLSQALKEVEQQLQTGKRDAEQLRSMIRQRISTKPLAAIDYISISDLASLEEVDTITGPILIALAVRFGKTRLIDNITWEG